MQWGAVNFLNKYTLKYLQYDTRIHPHSNTLRVGNWGHWSCRQRQKKQRFFSTHKSTKSFLAFWLRPLATSSVTTTLWLIGCGFNPRLAHTKDCKKQPFLPPCLVLVFWGLRLPNDSWVQFLCCPLLTNLMVGGQISHPLTYCHFLNFT